MDDFDENHFKSYKKLRKLQNILTRTAIETTPPARGTVSRIPGQAFFSVFKAFYNFLMIFIELLNFF